LNSFFNSVCLPTKNLHFSEESIGIIFRIHSSNAADVATTIQNFLEEGMAMASAMIP